MHYDLTDLNWTTLFLTGGYSPGDFTLQVSKTIDINNALLKDLIFHKIPHQDRIVLGKEFKKETEFKILNYSGQTIKSGAIKNETILISDLRPGNYELKIGQNTSLLLVD